MTRSRRKLRRSDLRKFVMLEEYMLNSEAWMSLTTQGRAVYVELSRRFNGSNNGELSLSIREAARLCRIANDTAAKALKELEAKGFIAVIQKGSFGYKIRHATIYRLTAFPTESEMATKDFMRWLNNNSVLNEKQNAIRLGPLHQDEQTSDA